MSKNHIFLCCVSKNIDNWVFKSPVLLIRFFNGLTKTEGNAIFADPEPHPYWPLRAPEDHGPGRLHQGEVRPAHSDRVRGGYQSRKSAGLLLPAETSTDRSLQPEALESPIPSQVL